MTYEKHPVARVFGLTRRVPETYVVRQNVDTKLREAIASEKHVIIRGDSKQGKTCLRKTTIPDSECIAITCIKDWGFIDICRNILSKAGYTESVNTVLSEGSGKLAAKGKFSFFGNEAGLEAEGAKKGSTSISHKQIEINLLDMAMVMDAFTKVCPKKYVVLDDFHYLSITTQRDFAFGLKAVYEQTDVIFVIVGVWKEENRLVMMNGDLQGRMIDVEVGYWNNLDLLRVVEKGEKLLNIVIDDVFKNQVISRSYNSVYIVQEACKKLCIRNGVSETLPKSKKIGSFPQAQEILQEIKDENNLRYEMFIANFLNLRKYSISKTHIEDYITIIRSIMLDPLDRIGNGIDFQHLIIKKRKHFPKIKNYVEENLKNALLELTVCQAAIGVAPSILYYDSSSARLTVVDRGFLFWLSRIDREEMLKQQGLFY